MIKIERVDINQINAEDLKRLYEIVIIAYRETEKEVWGENYTRISQQEFTTHIRNGEVLLARNEIGNVVGGIRYFYLRENTWSFGLLGAAFEEKGKGIGRELIQKVEEIAKERGAHQINIEILRAVNQDVVFKKRLSDWYQRLGYTYIKEENVLNVYNNPIKWSALVNPSVFDCYQKKLE